MNLGIPVVVVVTRADGASALESQKTIGWGEAIEVYIRNECLSYGAAIVYTMVQAKSSKNVDVLYEYLVHRLYGFSFKRPANQPSRDAVFVPSGWDSQEKIQKAAEGLQGGGLELSFESRITPLDAPADAAPALEACEDMQTFLRRSSGILQRLGGASAAGTRGLGAAGTGASAAAGGAATADTPGAAGGAAAGAACAEAPATKRGSMTSQGPIDNSSLANFFQNLLTRGQSGDGWSGDDKRPWRKYWEFAVMVWICSNAMPVSTRKICLTNRVNTQRVSVTARSERHLQNSPSVFADGVRTPVLARPILLPASVQVPPWPDPGGHAALTLGLARTFVHVDGTPLLFSLRNGRLHQHR
ncbi:unnamed protein product [Prorocentrum cordatum]|uniref:Dynein light intermediate chain n=1 Tax=Prorocentrum cordatum TaxID=2364126 RepID=A0ABN9PI78_9DINO|nr:unnamed protein product [Polarella glacialis]